MGSDVFVWFYNGLGISDYFGDFGYWVGYCIVCVYYCNFYNKVQVIQDILYVDNVNVVVFFVCSGWCVEDDCVLIDILVLFVVLLY